MLTKQAKILSPKMESAVLNHIRQNSQNPVRDQVIFLLTTRAAFRAVEVSKLEWQFLTDAQGVLTDLISLPNRASKGKSGGRTLACHPDLFAALKEQWLAAGKPSTGSVVTSSRTGKRMSAQVIVNMLWHLYRSVGMIGCSSHSGRRTWASTAARRVSTVGCTIFDVSQILGHASIQSTMKYVSPNQQGQRLLTTT
jgi:integrase